MQQHGSTYFDTPRGWDQLVKLTFSEHGHVAYRIKEFRKCSNIVANILPADPLPTLWMGSKGSNSTFYAQRKFWEAYSNRTVRPSVSLHVPCISSTFFEVGIQNLVCGCILGWQSVVYHFRVTVTFTSDLVFRIIVSGAYLLFYLRKESQIWCVDASWDNEV